jgi:PspA-Associated protein
VIVRILGEGQYRLDDAAFAAVNAIDDRVQAAADATDPDGFQAALTELVDTVVRLGTPLAPDEFEGSDAIVPGHGTTLEEARELLSSEGLIPD